MENILQVFGWMFVVYVVFWLVVWLWDPNAWRDEKEPPKKPDDDEKGA